jgi:hypothetical protein
VPAVACPVARLVRPAATTGRRIGERVAAAHIAWRRREYFDNYHAGATKKAGATAEAVRDMVIEARDRLLAGDVPGSRERKPAKVDRAKVTEFVRSMTDEEFAALLEDFTAARKAA